MCYKLCVVLIMKSMISTIIMKSILLAISFVVYLYAEAADKILNIVFINSGRF